MTISRKVSQRYLRSFLSSHLHKGRLRACWEGERSRDKRQDYFKMMWCTLSDPKPWAAVCWSLYFSWQKDVSVRTCVYVCVCPHTHIHIYCYIKVAPFSIHYWKFWTIMRWWTKKKKDEHKGVRLKSAHSIKYLQPTHEGNQLWTAMPQLPRFHASDVCR